MVGVRLRCARRGDGGVKFALFRKTELQPAAGPRSVRASSRGKTIMHARCRLGLTLLLVLASFGGHASVIAPPPPREASLAGLRYLVFETAGGQPDQTLPLIIGLHHSGARPEVLVPAFAALQVPARVVLPQGDQPRPNGFSWFPRDYGQLPVSAQDTAARQATDALSAFVQAIQAQYSGRGKPVIAGVSYGGDLAFLLALHHPGQVRAAFPIAARLPSRWVPMSFACQPHCPPLHALHGADDATVPMAPTRQAVEALHARGYPATLTSYPGVRHDFDASMQRDLRARLQALLDPAHVDPARDAAPSSP